MAKDSKLWWIMIRRWWGLERFFCGTAGQLWETFNSPVIIISRVLRSFFAHNSEVKDGSESGLAGPQKWKSSDTFFVSKKHAILMRNSMSRNEQEEECIVRYSNHFRGMASRSHRTGTNHVANFTRSCMRLFFKRHIECFVTSHNIRYFKRWFTCYLVRHLTC